MTVAVALLDVDGGADGGSRAVGAWNACPVHLQERSRPSFVSMQRAKRPHSRTRSGRKAGGSGSRGASPGGRAAFVAEGHSGGGGDVSS